MGRALTGVAAAAALALGIAIGWTIQAWQPSPDGIPERPAAPVGAPAA
ncbi:hypothetical protein [Demequina sp. NBRC 110056]|nr:hypothetical protein [Demequina sp. NBRC 110056]